MRALLTECGHANQQAPCRRSHSHETRRARGRASTGSRFTDAEALKPQCERGFPHAGRSTRPVMFGRAGSPGIGPELLILQYRLLGKVPYDPACRRRRRRIGTVNCVEGVETAGPL
jgi:hypothetical protein